MSAQGFICVLMQTCVVMAISVHVFAVVRISAALCIFFFAQSVIISTGLSAYVSMHRLTLVQVSLTMYPCILLFWALIIFVFFMFLYAFFRIWPPHLFFCAQLFLLVYVYQLWEELSMFVISCVGCLFVCLCVCIWLYLSFCSSVTRYFYIAVSLCWLLSVSVLLALCAHVPINLIISPPAFWGTHWILFWDT